MKNPEMKTRPKIISFFIEYGFHLILLLFFVNLTVAYVFHFYVVATGCMTVSQVQSDNRCLYIWNNQVYQKGDRSTPHQNHPCGTDVTTVLPASHLGGGMASHLLPNYIANICENRPTPTPTPSPTPTPKPTPSPTPTPTKTPSPTPTNSPNPTSTPTPTPTLQPTAHPSPTPTALPHVTPTFTSVPTPTPTTRPTQQTTPTPTDILTDSLIPTDDIGIDSPFPSDTPLPTATPTITDQLSSATVSISISLLGISHGGNISPVHQNRNVAILAYGPTDKIYDSDKPLFTAFDVATFDTTPASPTYSLFTNTKFNAPAIPPGQYQFFVQVSKYLKQQIIDGTTGNKVFALANGQTTQFPTITLTPGDINPFPNGDGIIDIADYNTVVGCYDAKITAVTCSDSQAADLNDDGIIDGIDYNIFLTGLREYLRRNNLLPSITPTITPIIKPTQPPAISPTPVITRITSTNKPTPALSPPAAIPTPIQPQTVIRTFIASISSNSALLTKIFDVLIFIIFCITLFVGVFRSKLLQKAKKDTPAVLLTPPEKITPLPAFLSSEQIVDRTFFVKPYKTDSAWVLLVDEDEKIFGYTNGKYISEGFARIKGNIKKSADSCYIDITDTDPAVE